MNTFMALLPALVWITLFIISIKRHGFNRIIFITSVSLSFLLVLLNLRSGSFTDNLTELLWTSPLILIWSMIVYTIINFIYNLIKFIKRKLSSSLNDNS